MPFVLHLLQSTQQELTHTELMLDHRERTFAHMTSKGIGFLCLGGGHLGHVTLAMRFVLFAVDLACYGLPLQATRSQRARRTRFGLGLITPPNALTRSAGFVGIIRGALLPASMC